MGGVYYDRRCALAFSGWLAACGIHRRNSIVRRARCICSWVLGIFPVLFGTGSVDRRSAPCYYSVVARIGVLVNGDTVIGDGSVAFLGSTIGNEDPGGRAGAARASDTGDTVTASRTPCAGRQTMASPFHALEVRWRSG